MRHSLYHVILTLSIFLLTLSLGFNAMAREDSQSSLVIDNPDEVPAPMPTIEEGAYDILNIMLLGSDTANPLNAGRTDVIVIVSVNRSANTVSLLSLPRDLYVYIPGERVYRINSAYGYGEQSGVGGAELLRQTIAYNLGTQIDFFARVDFRDFQDIVDALGGVDISVDCSIHDWRLREPELDPTVEENWEIFTLPVGVHHMDGNLALWYARSRRTTSDFDRGRRQQALLRAMWHRIRDLGLVSQLTELWSQVTGVVETDLHLEDMLGLIPLAAQLDSAHIRSFTFRQNVEVRPWRSPEGSDVLVPNRDVIQRVIENMYQPATERQFVREQPSVEIVNGSGYRNLGQVAADRLAWEGFIPVISNEVVASQEHTTLIDFTGQSKGSSLGLLENVVRVNQSDVVIQPSPDRQYDFQVILGSNYSACTYGLPPLSDGSQ